MKTLLSSNTAVWLLLLLLTGAGYIVAETGLGGVAIAAAVLLVTLLKGELVVHRFMGLAQVGWRWRAIMSAYLLLVLGLIGVAYGLAL